MSFFLPYNAQSHYRAYGNYDDDQQYKYGIMIHGDPFSSTNLKQHRCQTANAKQIQQLAGFYGGKRRVESRYGCQD